MKFFENIYFDARPTNTFLFTQHLTYKDFSNAIKKKIDTEINRINFIFFYDNESNQSHKRNKRQVSFQPFKTPW